MKWSYSNAELNYTLEYEVYDCKTVTADLLKTITCWHPFRVDSSRNIKGKAHYECHSVGYKSYLNIPMSFDIETTSLETGAYMYIWMFAIYNNVIIGRTWEDFKKFLYLLADIIEAKQSQRVIVWVHNLSFEFQFIRRLLDFSDCNGTFFKEARKILYGKPADLPFEFKDSMAMTNSSLKRLAKDYCKVQKLVGDLDYRKLRNSKTLLTDQEYRYCHNDVLILTQFAEWFWNEYILKYKCPLTCTGALYSEVKDLFKKLKKEGKIKKHHIVELYNAWPETIDEYHIWMNYVYRGGYTHGSERCIDIEYDDTDNVFSFDFTSSYPAVMLIEEFPMQFYEVKNCTESKLADIINNNYAFIGHFIFYNIKRAPWSSHSVESKSKCIAYDNCKLDNGRIRSADLMEVWLTEQDWLTYKEFYVWDNVEIVELKVAAKMKLPSYLIQNVIKYAILKNKLKHEGLPYALEKAKLNSFYGLCVKKVIEIKIIYDGENYVEENTLNWSKEKERILLPQWGIWISGYARRNLLKTVHKIEMIHKQVAYCDTDSLKIINFDSNADSIIKQYNDDIHIKLNKALLYYGVDKDNIQYIKDLGEFDCEGKFDRLKILGAKRYVYTMKGKFNQVIAGLPKNTLMDLYNDVDKCFENFTDNLNIIDSGKLMAKYFDDITYDDVDGEEMMSYSSVALLPCTFTMKMDGDWKQYIEFIKKYRLVEDEIYD